MGIKSFHIDQDSGEFKEDSKSRKTSLMIGLVLVIMFLLISKNAIIEPMLLNGKSFQNVFV